MFNRVGIAPRVLHGNSSQKACGEKNRRDGRERR